MSLSCHCNPKGEYYKFVRGVNNINSPPWISLWGTMKSHREEAHEGETPELWCSGCSLHCCELTGDRTVGGCGTLTASFLTGHGNSVLNLLMVHLNTVVLMRWFYFILDAWNSGLYWDTWRWGVGLSFLIKFFRVFTLDVWISSDFPYRGY